MLVYHYISTQYIINLRIEFALSIGQVALIIVTIFTCSSTQQHSLENPPNTLSAITISRPNSQAVEITSLSDLDRRPDGAEQAECGEPGEFYSGSRNSNPLDKVRPRTSGSSDSPHATTFGKESRKSTSEKQGEEDPKNRTSVTSSAGISRTSHSSVSGASLGTVEVSDALVPILTIFHKMGTFWYSLLSQSS